MAAQGFVAVVGARVLPGAWAHQVGDLVRYFVGRGWGIGSGGARGADAYALHALLGCGRAACGRSAVFVPGPIGAWENRELRSFRRLARATRKQNDAQPARQHLHETPLVRNSCVRSLARGWKRNCRKTRPGAVGASPNLVFRRSQLHIRLDRRRGTAACRVGCNPRFPE